MITKIISVCCICGVKYGEKNGHGNEGVSHGYCKECTDKVMKEWGLE